jgi:alpha-L-arabinofuranosidase
MAPFATFARCARATPLHLPPPPSPRSIAVLFDPTCVGGAGHLPRGTHVPPPLRPYPLLRAKPQALAAGKHRTWRAPRARDGAWGGWNWVDALDGSLTANVTLDGPLSANITTSLLINVTAGVPAVSDATAAPLPPLAGQAVGLCNWGYWGVTFVANAGYNVSFLARAVNTTVVYLTLEAGNSTDPADPAFPFTVIAAKPVTIPGGGQTVPISVQLTANAADSTGNGRLCWRVATTGNVWIGATSLQPTVTWMNRPNGMRPDLAQYVANLKPGFLRVPGADAGGGGGEFSRARPSA